MKTPISYYGGKQQMVKDILPLIPSHSTYVEPFCGGAAIFWAKPQSAIEVINDLNGNVANFYAVMQTDFERLKRLIKVTVHSHASYNDATVIYKNPHLFGRVRRAWAFWVSCNSSYGCSPGAGWAFQKREKNRCAGKVIRAGVAFVEEFAERIKAVSVECDDAIKVIKRFDSPCAFHYVDPPYYNSDMGHYGGYTESDFKELLNTLAKVEGKFLLSSYDSEPLREAIKANGWQVREIEKPLSMAKGKRKKIEVLTANYELPVL